MSSPMSRLRRMRPVDRAPLSPLRTRIALRAAHESLESLEGRTARPQMRPTIALCKKRKDSACVVSCFEVVCACVRVCVCVLCVCFCVFLCVYVFF